MDRLQMLYSLLDSTITESELLAVVASLVGQPVVLMNERLSGIQGYCVQLCDAYVIGVSSDLTDIGRANTLGHEIAHILMGHVPASDLMLAAWTKHADYSRSRQRQANSYDNDEYIAERAGRVIGQYLSGGGKQIPAALRRVKR